MHLKNIKPCLDYEIKVCFAKCDTYVVITCNKYIVHFVMLETFWQILPYINCLKLLKSFLPWRCCRRTSSAGILDERNFRMENRSVMKSLYQVRLEIHFAEFWRDVSFAWEIVCDYKGGWGGVLEVCHFKNHTVEPCFKYTTESFLCPWKKPLHSAQLIRTDAR